MSHLASGRRSGAVRLRALRVAMFVVVVSAATTALAQDTAPESRAAASRPFVAADFSAAGMAQRIEHFRPALEAELGSSLGGPVIVRPVDREALGRVILEELVPLRAEMSTVAKGTMLRRLLEDGVHALGGTAFAKVGIADRVIYVVPQNLRSVAKSAEPGEVVLSQELLDGILVHETVHVWQDHHLSLGRFYGAPRSSDEFQCRAAVVEGHAQCIARRVLARVGSGAEMDLVRRAQRSIPEWVKSHSTVHELEVLVETELAAYSEGETFVTDVVRRLGLPEATRRLLTEPPLSRAELVDPAAWVEHRGSGFDPELTAAAVRGVMRADGLAVEVPGLPVTALKLILAPAGGDLEPITRAVRGTTALTGMSVAKAMRHPNASTEVDVVRLADDASATALVDAWARALVAGRASSDAESRSTETRQDAEDLPFEGGPAKAGLIVTKPERGRATSTRWVVLGRGPTVVAVLARNGDDARDDVLALGQRALAAVSESEQRAASRADSAPASRPTEALVRGRVTYAGGDQPVPDFEIRFWTGKPDFRIVSAHGHDGAFEIQLPKSRTCLTGAILVGGVMNVSSVGLHPKFDGEPFELEIQRRDLVTFRVVAAETNQPLTDAQGQRVSRWRMDREIVLAGDSTDAPAVAVDTDGLLRLDRSPYDGVIISAPGRRSVAIAATDSSDDVEKVVSLEPGGGMHLVVRGFGSLAEPGLSLRRLAKKADGDFELTYPCDLPAADASGSVTVDGLPLGTYVVLLRRGDPRHGPVVASAELRITAGTFTEVVLDPVIDPHAVDVKLVFTAPESWARTMQLEAAISDGDERPVGTASVRIGRGARRAEARLQKVPPGRYRLSVREILWQTEIEVGAAGTVDVALPELVRVTVRAVDEETGEALSKLSCRKSRKPGSGTGESELTGFDSANGKDKVTLFLAPGPFELRLASENHRGTTQTGEAVAGSSPELTVKLAPAGSVHVTLRDDAGAMVKVAIVEVSGARGYAFNGEATVGELSPGHFDVTMVEAEGYLLPPPTPVDVKLRETTEVTIVLKRQTK